MNRLRAPKTLTLTLPLALGLFAPTESEAQRLQHCTPGQPALNANAQLPIGNPGDAMFTEKNILYDYLRTIDPGAVEFPGGPPPLTLPVHQYAQVNQGVPYTGQSCSTWIPNTPSLSASDRLELERIWMIWAHYQDTVEAPAMEMLETSADAFTLGKIEDLTDCFVIAPPLQWDTTPIWLARWEYPGNPYHHDLTIREPLLRRTSIWLALNLIMLDARHWNSAFPAAPAFGFVHPSSGPSQDLAGHIGHLAYAYLVAETFIPDWVKPSMVTMLRMYAERLMAWPHIGGQLNMTVRATWGMYLAHLATGAPNLQTHYGTLVDEFFGNQSQGRYFPAGYLLDDGRYDAGYNGYNMMHALSVLLLDPGAPGSVLPAVEQMIDLQAHSTFRDPDGTWYSPLAYNSRSSGGAIKPIAATSSRMSPGGGVNRYLPAAKLGVRWSHAFLRDAWVMGPQLPGALDPNSATYEQDLICAVNDPIFWLSHAITNNNWTDDGLEWGQFGHDDRSYATPQVPIESFTANDITDWRNTVAGNASLELFPFEQAPPYVHSMDDEFVYARFSGPNGEAFAALIHAGPVSGGDFNINLGGPYYLPAGFGGGQVSMFWGPFTGAASRAMRKGYNNAPVTFDDWAAWRSWPIHASTFLTATGWTSSARIVAPDRDVRFHIQGIPRPQLMSELDTFSCPGSPDPSSATVTTNEALGAAVLVRTCGKVPRKTRRFAHTEDVVMSATILYERAIYAGDEGVYVRTHLTPQFADVIDEAWETIPIYDQSVWSVTNYSPATIIFVINGVAQPWVPSTTPTPNVSQVYVTRANGAFRVVFDYPETVLISDQYIHGAARTRNIMVDLGRGQLPAALPVTELGYTYEMLTHANGYSPPP